MHQEQSATYREGAWPRTRPAKRYHGSVAGAASLLFGCEPDRAW